MSHWPPVDIEPEISKDPKKVVEELYRLISFNSGDLPAWDRFISLFTENAVMSLRLFPGDPHMWTGPPTEYSQVQVDQEMQEHGYSETPVKEDWMVFGDVAEGRVTFDMQRGDQPAIRCFDGYHLVFQDSRWWVTSILGEIPTTNTQVPKDIVS